MAKSSEPSGEQEILRHLSKAGATGLSKTQLGIRGSKTPKADVLESLLKRREIANIGSDSKKRYVLAQYFQPLEMAYKHIETLSNQRGIKLSSQSVLTVELKGQFKKKADEALKLLVQEGKLIKLSYAGRPIYLHSSALPLASPLQSPSPPSPPLPSLEAIRNAYNATVTAFGYPDVRIHEVFLRLGGNLETFKATLKQACQEGITIPSVGDWALSSPDERNAALYVNGDPHLRIRFSE